jgi:hypothetical protein
MGDCQVSSDQPRQGYCWLCSTFGDLTEEHIPPHSAFNECPLLLRAISERSRETGTLTWDSGRLHQRGLSVRSLCASCNSRAGRRFAPSYIRLVKTIAERVGNIREQHQLTIQRIEKPALLLRQVVQQFVTANGATFVQANPWVRTFLRPELRQNLPDDVFIYLFATNRPCARMTGMSGHVYAGKNQVRVVSEFTFWPVGTVLSYGDLADKRLAAIHHWSSIPHTSNQTADVTLTVNPVNSALPIDFRGEDEVLKDRAGEATKAPSESALTELQREVFKRGGYTSEKDFIFTAHPSQVKIFGRNDRRTR